MTKADAERIAALEARIKQLEERLSMVEARPVSYPMVITPRPWAIPETSPYIVTVPNTCKSVSIPIVPNDVPPDYSTTAIQAVAS